MEGRFHSKYFICQSVCSMAPQTFFQVIALLSYFGGLRHSELMELKIENMISSSEGVSVTHARAKQRSDKKETRFTVPMYYKCTVKQSTVHYYHLAVCLDTLQN